MSEMINNTEEQKKSLRNILLRIHRGEDPQALRGALVGLLQHIPYDAVVEVEQQLLAEGMPVEEIQNFCDVHSQVLNGHIEAPSPELEVGHPAQVLMKENDAILALIAKLRSWDSSPEASTPEGQKNLRLQWQLLMDVDKHYRRKEYLLFPYLEKAGIEGPPKVMWGKQDEIRAHLRAVWEGLKSPQGASATQEARTRALQAVEDMVGKESQIFLPLCLDTLKPGDWWEVYQQTLDYGFCLVEPEGEWNPSPDLPGAAAGDSGGLGTPMDSTGLVRLFSGSFTTEELTAVLNALPVDVTFVDAQDKVRYFSQSSERIFDRSRAILGRDVRLCHPPHSVSTVETILTDFKSGKESRAPFWIQMGPRFIHIEYFALRSADGTYLGCLEVSQDLTEKRALQGEQRLLAYGQGR